jgi:putative ABC transport system substrate-binding protein
VKAALPGWLLLLACLTAGCTDNPSAPDVASSTAQRVLVISIRGSANTPRLVAMLAAGGLGTPPMRSIATDVEWVETAAEAVSAVRRHQPLQRYRAIYTNSITYARAAQIVTSEVPIVFEGVDDPVVRCVVDSVQRPGRNATGYMHYLHDDDHKLMQLLRDAYPRLRDVLMLVSAENQPPPSCDPESSYWQTAPNEPCHPGERPLDGYISRRVLGPELQAQAASVGVRLRFVVVCSLGDLPALARWGQGQPAAGWMVPWQALFDRNRSAVIAALGGSRLPAVYPHPGYARLGGLMSLSPTMDDGPDRASWLALMQVLDGANPATLPVQSPRGFQLVVNASAAAQLPERPSTFVLRRADLILR